MQNIQMVNNNNSMTGDHETPDTPNLYNTLSQAS